MDHIMPIYEQGRSFIAGIANEGAMHIDLKQVDQIDSSVLAMLIHWITTARSKNLTVHFQNKPACLMQLLEAFNLQSFFSTH